MRGDPSAHLWHTRTGMCAISPRNVEQVFPVNKFETIQIRVDTFLVGRARGGPKSDIYPCRVFFLFGCAWGVFFFAYTHTEACVTNWSFIDTHEITKHRKLCAAVRRVCTRYTRGHSIIFSRVCVFTGKWVQGKQCGVFGLEGCVNDIDTIIMQSLFHLSGHQSSAKLECVYVTCIQCQVSGKWVKISYLL